MNRFAATLFLLTLAVFPALADSPPGGDVLRPKRDGPSEFRWYLGLDAGLTWSSFFNGPIAVNVPSPYFTTHPYFDSNVPFVDLSLMPCYVDKGNGLGFTIGGAIDLGFSKWFGLIGKVNYHTRAGHFDENSSMTAPALVNGVWSTISLVQQEKHDWTLNYVGIDILARFQLVPESWYLFVGPSLGFLSTNTFKFDKAVISPTDMYYLEETGIGLASPNQFRTMSGSTTVDNLEKSRVDVKGGVGVWIPIANKLYLTPEVSLAYPATKLVTGLDFNVMTIFATVGLRWQMN
jgi:hypothetical protein